MTTEPWRVTTSVTMGAFDDYCTTTHTPLALKIPRLAGMATGKCRSLVPGQQPPYYMVASLSFANLDDLKAGLRSPEMAAASADVVNFATGAVTLYSTDALRVGPCPGGGAACRL
jgi:uncharacterized protein (TIGR02118 family)